MDQQRDRSCFDEIILSKVFHPPGHSSTTCPQSFFLSLFIVPSSSSLLTSKLKPVPSKRSPLVIMTKITLAAILVISFISPFVMAVTPQRASSSSTAAKSSTYSKASFVPPAAPSVVSAQTAQKKSWSSWSPVQSNPTSLQNIVTGYGTYPSPKHVGSGPVTLFAKKKGSSKSGGVQAVSKKGKIQVQLTQTVPNIGQSGDIIFVSSAVFQNQLKKNNSARLITDEEVRKLEDEREAKEEELLEMAKQTKSMLEATMLENLGGEEQCGDDGEGDICGIALELKRKAGPEGNLFGGVTPKMVIEGLKESYPDGSWDGKQVKVLDMKDANGHDVPKMDIKHVGEYTIKLSLGKEVEAKFILSVQAE
mmetsp:Transcript_3325/g.6908  ORF Transcript_3325/g.6908 Transcript_3325/m.6908 type:complete len:364 (+) Transcript_3325:2-1093(+)